MPELRPKRIMVFCLSGLGDAILASAALAALAARPDQFRLTLLTMFRSVKEYLDDQQFTPDVRLIQFLGMSKWNIFHHAWPLRKEQFDVSVLPYAMNRLGYNLMSRVVGARYRIGFRYQRQFIINAPALNQCVIDEDPSLHAVQENLRWASVLCNTGVDALPDEFSYRIHPSAVTAADAYLKEHKLDQAAPLIGIHAACNSLKNQHCRCWPPIRLGEFIRRFREQTPGARFILFEGPSDQQMNEAVVVAAGPASGDIVVAKMLPLRLVAALVKRCHLFLSNDSGMMHTAAACKVPCASIFGPTNPAWVRPWKTQNIIVSRQLPCSPCFYYSSRPLVCPAHLDFACVRDIAVDDVLNAVQQLLAQTHVHAIPVQT